jgi:hypothetical protein
MAQRSPTNLTTSRNRALEIGTQAAGFAGGVDMEGDASRAGYPSVAGMPGTGGYKEQAPAVGGSPVDGPKPFTLGGGK